MSTYHSLTIIHSRIDQEIGLFTQFPIYLALNTFQQLDVHSEIDSSMFQGYCIDKKDGEFVVRPLNPNFTLFLYQEEQLDGDDSTPILIDSTTNLPKEASFAVSRTEGPEWDIILNKQDRTSVQMCPKCHDFYKITAPTCPHCGHKSAIDDHSEFTLPYQKIVPKTPSELDDLLSTNSPITEPTVPPHSNKRALTIPILVTVIVIALLVTQLF